MVHGINDERGSHDCLYVTFSSKELFSEAERGAMAVVLPYIDTALRQVEHLPHQAHPLTTSPSLINPVDASLTHDYEITAREAEVLRWVAMGKTNPEIGTILDISSFTVKNHMQRLFKKLNVTNRAQAVGKFNALQNLV